MTKKECACGTGLKTIPIDLYLFIYVYMRVRKDPDAIFFNLHIEKCFKKMYDRNIIL